MIIGVIYISRSFVVSVFSSGSGCRSFSMKVHLSLCDTADRGETANVQVDSNKQPQLQFSAVVSKDAPRPPFITGLIQRS